MYDMSFILEKLLKFLFVTFTALLAWGKKWKSRHVLFTEIFHVMQIHEATQRQERWCGLHRKIKLKQS